MGLEEVMSSLDFVAELLDGFAEAFQPVEDSLGSVDAFAVFLAEFGWTLRADASIDELIQLFGGISQSITSLQQAAQALSNSTSDDELQKAIQVVVTVVGALVN